MVKMKANVEQKKKFHICHTIFQTPYLKAFNIIQVKDDMLDKIK